MGSKIVHRCRFRIQDFPEGGANPSGEGGRCVNLLFDFFLKTARKCRKKMDERGIPCPTS